MQRLFLLVAFALLSHEALCGRIIRQSGDDNEENLEDRYGWNRPNRFPNQGQFPWQGRFPSQGGWRYPQSRFPNMGDWSFPETMFPGNFPWQFPGNQGQFPGNQGQLPGNQGQLPGNQGQLPGNQGQNPGQPNQQTTPAPSGTTTQSAVLQDCIRTCLVTPEYNPVCGSDNVTYDNPGRLLCAQSCGVSVTQTRASRCPAATAATAAPAS